jgi:hypothetical protein
MGEIVNYFRINRELNQYEVIKEEYIFFKAGIGF